MMMHTIVLGPKDCPPEEQPEPAVPMEVGADAGDTVIDQSVCVSSSGDDVEMKGDSIVAKGDDFFPLLSLPPELVQLVFKKHLSTQDRLRARAACSALYLIEAKETYRLQQLNVVDDVGFQPGCGCRHAEKDGVTMFLTRPADDYPEALAKLTANTEFKSIYIELSTPSYGALFDTLVGIEAPELMVAVKDEALRDSLLTAQRVQQLLRGRKTVRVCEPLPEAACTPEVLGALFQALDGAPDSASAVTVYDVPAETAKTALANLGIYHCEDDHLHAARRDIEVFTLHPYVFIIMGERLIVAEETLFLAHDATLLSFQRFDADGNAPYGMFRIPKEQMRGLHEFECLYADQQPEEAEAAVL